MATLGADDGYGRDAEDTPEEGAVPVMPVFPALPTRLEAAMAACFWRKSFSDDPDALFAAVLSTEVIGATDGVFVVRELPEYPPEVVRTRIDGDGLDGRE